MFLKTSSLLFILFLASCQPDKPRVLSEEIESKDFISSKYLIEAEALKSCIDHRHIKVLDLSKNEIYLTEHIQGAFAISRSDIEDKSYSYSGMMASPDQIEKLFSKLGISTQDTLILYDNNGSCDALRLWWILQNYDFTNVKILNGGLEAWKESHGLISEEIPKAPEARFELSKSPSMQYYISMENVMNAVKSQTVILDCRSLDEYSGKRQKSGAKKAGRIPGAIHFDWAMAINHSGDKKFKSISDLEKLYSSMGVKKEDTIIVYCHSGFRSAHTTFVLTEMLGYKNVKNYDGSWIEWSQNENLSFVKDSTTTILY